MMQAPPLVSVICLCYNHAPYVAEALASVWSQTYKAVELIVIDDASTDESQQVIRRLLQEHPEVPFIALEENKGNCYAFNRGLALAQGEWVIDLAADDILLPERISTQIDLAQSLPADYGVIFSDAWLVNEAGDKLNSYYPRNAEGHLISPVPQGVVFADLLRSAFICTPTMLMRKTLLNALGGYDEALSYEDYDFWVRSGKNWKYAFQDALLTEKRVLKHSHGQSFYQTKHSPHLASTLIICQKALAMVESKEEKQALATSVRYHLRQCLWMECFDLAFGFISVLEQLEMKKTSDFIWQALASLKLPLNRWYRLYRNITPLLLF
jgi:glycosyltransferase involved in cell wall biosynthesis